jgi:hypothetical protein
MSILVNESMAHLQGIIIIILDNETRSDNFLKHSEIVIRNYYKILKVDFLHDMLEKIINHEIYGSRYLIPSFLVSIARVTEIEGT